MITKEDVDNFFKNNMALLEPIAKGLSYKNNRDIHEYITISYAYEYCLNNYYKLKSTKEIQKMAIGFIKDNLGWKRSQLNIKEGKCINREYLDIQQPDDDISLENKILIEKWYDEKKSILVMYRIQEKDRVKQNIFDVYFNKGITKGVDMAKHFNINKDAASKYIREMKKDIYQFYIEYINK